MSEILPSSAACPSDPADPAGLQQVFLDLRDLPRAERAARLRALRARDEPLARGLEELLHADDSNTGFLESPALGPQLAWSAVAAAEESSAHVAPERIGRYWIQGVLGKGGMGVVYRAGQENPRREVALKVLRGSRVTPARLKRFEHEAELLARLQHPGIAQVFEAGTVLDDGRVQAFIAMELVAGEHLGEHALRVELDARARLVLLLRIAEAVAHAHQKGVVHRDLKPENILVDAAGGPKIVDFGVARLVGTDSDLTTLHTEAGRLIGTPWYMAPEQLSGDPDAADTRSDVYALGVIGYELCAGRMPYELEGRPLPEVARVIRDVEPARLDPGRLASPDLAPVLGKCLEKEPARRYGSASELAADLARVLANEPVTARPPSGIYLLRKFVRRNRGLAAGVGVAALALALGTLGFALQARRATDERDRALEAGQLAKQRSEEAKRERDRAVEAEKLAEQRLRETSRERDKFEEGFKFMRGMLSAVEPERFGKDVRVADILEGASKALPEVFPADPEIAASLHRAIGVSWRALGQIEDALAELRLARELLEKTPEASDLDVVRNDLALVLTELGKYEEAEQIYRLALDHQRSTVGPTALHSLITQNNLAALRARLGDPGEAGRLFADVLAASEHLERDATVHHLRASASRGLANLMSERGEREEAQVLIETAYDGLRSALGEQDADVLSTLSTLAVLEAERGEVESAIGHLEESLAGLSEVLPAGHPSLLAVEDSLGSLLLRAGRAAEAERRLAAVLESRSRVLGPENPSTLTTAGNLARAWLELGQVEDAEALLRETKEALERTLPAGHWMPLTTGIRLAECWTKLGDLEGAREQLEASYAGLRAALGPTAEKTQSALRLLVDVLERTGDAGRAAELRAELQ